jgi:hypothetical protein
VTVPAGWYTDPWVPQGVRYWDGATWTLDVARKPPPGKPPHPELPLVVAVGAVVTIGVSLVASRFLVSWLSDYRWPVFWYMVVAATIGYGPVLLFGVWASRRWGHHSLRADSGLFFRRTDFGWGPLVWLACMGSNIVMAVLVTVLHIPFMSNLEPVENVHANRGYVIALLVVGVVVAPVVEEMVFRGYVLRGFLSRMGPVAAVALQAVLFGMAHFDPVRGTGNIGLIMVLSGVGAVLGGAEYLFRRIGPTMLAHAIINGLALTLALTGWLVQR